MSEIEWSRPIQQLLPAVLDQVELPVRAQPPIADVHQPGGRRERAEVDARRVIAPLHLDEIFERTTQVAAEPRAGTEPIVAEVIASKRAELERNPHEQAARGQTADRNPF